MGTCCTPGSVLGLRSTRGSLAFGAVATDRQVVRGAEEKRDRAKGNKFSKTPNSAVLSLGLSRMVSQAFLGVGSEG